MPNRLLAEKDDFLILTGIEFHAPPGVAQYWSFPFCHSGGVEARGEGTWVIYTVFQKKVVHQLISITQAILNGFS